MVIDFDIFALLGFFLIFGLIGWFLKTKRDKDRVYLIFYGFFCLYLMAMLSNTVFPLAYIGHEYPPNLWHSINFIPLVGIFKLESLLNIGILVPFGFAVPFVRTIPGTKAMVPIVLIPGLIIELLQFLSGLASAGYTWRLIDINDYLCYAVGIALGYLVFRLIASLILDLFPDGFQGEKVAMFVQRVFERSTPKKEREAFGDEGY